MLNRLSSLATVLAVSGALLVAGAGQAAAQSQVGDSVFVRGIGFLTITEVLPDGGFLAGNPLNLFDSSEYIILGTTDAGVVAVGDMITDPTTGVIAEVTAVVLNGYGELESVTFDNGSLVNLASELDARGSGLAYDLNDPAPGPGDINSVAVHRFGPSGGNGRDGYPFHEANNGAGGQPGLDNTWEVPDTHGDIVTHTDRLAGIIATSLGGNGGNGGDGYAGASAAAGGAGGAGGTVVLTSRVGNITTYGIQAHGVVAQSRSGIGGAGGDVILSLGSGGTGGVGNSGGSATVNNYSTIITHGEGSIGVFAQSLGGGGGVAGSSYGLFGAAGDGDVGGDGGAAEAINFGSVTTYGAHAYGVSAQSVGGIGGNAGSAGGLWTFSSAGAPGGAGGSAIVRSQTGSSVITFGEAAYGLFAQSVGGGGGNGGSSTGLVALGSTGAAGGIGGSASVFMQADSSVATTGVDAHAIFAQSIGGGGGNAGWSGGLLSLGGTGGAGNTGGDVTVDAAGLVVTTNTDARGIFAQSVGGGGGSARATGGVFAFGGSGDGGGNGGLVSVTTRGTATIFTVERGSDAIFAQSVGGGGGSGSSAGGIKSLGGGGGAGGFGNTVTVDHGGVIVTQGDFARGIFAQSIGGGGGSGGDSYGLITLGGDGGGVDPSTNSDEDSASAGGNVTVTNRGTVLTAGNMSSAIQAQSIGGGGGDGGTTGGAALSIGGIGGGGGASGTVIVNHYGFISTGLVDDVTELVLSGDDSHGIFAQSVGGGGGNGGSSRSLSLFSGVTLGGAGGDGGDGGLVQVNLLEVTAGSGLAAAPLTAFIGTVGDRARGIFAQSVGGGGGNGGFTAQATIGSMVGQGVSIGGSGGSGGLGGLVELNGQANILTLGDFSEGILAQSVGGGGGTGGFATTITYTGAGVAGGSFALAVGGSGGLGGNGGQVTLDAGGSIYTGGQFSTGLLAQSVGGGGGNGGFSTSFSITAAGVGAASVGTGVGGSGGDGGDGGDADANYGGAITTISDDSRGAVIQSIGGGGGNGGFNISGSIAAAGSIGGATSVGVGGSGGGGGQGGAVSGTVDGSVETRGDRSIGVVIQSVGGGGGTGGYNISGSVAASGSLAGAVSVGVGGAGETGGNGGEVDATGGDILTHGNQAGGFLAQSVGGGGGAGGMNVSGAVTASGNAAAGVAVGVGGSGAGGGTGGNVYAQVTGDVWTLGADSDAIIAQSVGGGGGNGGINISSTLSVSLGGAGASSIGVGGSAGTGSNAGAVELGVDGFTVTSQRGSDGIIAQSIGGGGGSGGLNTSDSVSLSADAGGTIGVGTGGSGGGGGDGGQATLRLNEFIADGDNTLGAVWTAGDDARAIIVQSVGGGGGSGGVNVTGSVSFSGANGANIAVGIGGSGGDGGDSLIPGDPDVIMAYALVRGDITTEGDRSSAVLVQSLGGGGGNGGTNITGGFTAATAAAGNILVGVGGFGGDGGNGGRVDGSIESDISTGTLTLDLADEWVTTGHDAFGITFQSLGGGGGNGGLNITGGVSASGILGSGILGVGVGGFGGDGGFGSAVNGDFTGSIITRGDRAHGILLQSLGGGGGNGGINITGVVSLASGSAGSVGVGVGGFGGGGGHSGAVTGVLDGQVVTLGDGAFGAIAQSLGGGGGNGGLNITGAFTANRGGAASGSLAVGIGGFGGDGGASDDVAVTVRGDYETFGANALGVLAQSLAGGGGNGGLNFAGAVTLGMGAGGAASVGIGGFGGDAASRAGDVALVREGSTFTHGDGSDGVTAQSIGGGGGNGGINISGGVSATQGEGVSVGFGLGGFGGEGGDAGNVTANIQGNVSAEYANGVMVQSQGGGGGNGGMNITGQLSISGDSGRAVSLGIGGFGGAGGSAGTAHLTFGAADTDFAVLGNGDEHSAIIVQSVGGGGGSGGINISGGVSSSGNLVAGVGGFGGGGGVGGAVSGDIRADLFADGLRAHGLLAQSVGGGGGSGGINISAGVNSAGITGDASDNDPSLVFGMGGFGGDGNRSGNVDIAHHGDVRVGGDQSVGLLVQSVAGGGGAGGMNVSSNLALSESTGFAVSVGIGGSGGEGANAGLVSLDSNGRIDMRGASFSSGIIAQSIGGGGGQGGMNIVGAIAKEGSPVGIGIGGFAGSGGDGNAVSVTRGLLEQAWLTTQGDNSAGLIAQSIGGGGGNAGMNLGMVATRASGTSNTPRAALIQIGGDGGTGGSGGAVQVDHRGNIDTRGVASAGLFAQSLGGGGGSGSYTLDILSSSKATFAFGLNIGGANGNGGSGDDVTVRNSGDIFTFGNDSNGLIAQSIGGGGGSVATSLIFDLVGTAAGSIGSNLGQKPKRSINIALGRSGGSGGASGLVTVYSEGSITTTGDRSTGLLAQSIGGGGGNSGTSSFAATGSTGGGNSPTRVFETSLSVGVEGGSGSTGGVVDVMSFGDITTGGFASHAIHAQSIGGGGGAGGSASSPVGKRAVSITTGVGGSGGSGNDSDTVSVASDGRLATAGDHSDGIFAQSIGGGGGVGGNAASVASALKLFAAGDPNGSTTVNISVGGSGGNASSGDAVDVINTGIITTTGERSFGIRAQSIGGGGGDGGTALSGRRQVAGNNISTQTNLGGAGGSAGTSGLVDVINEGFILTTGTESIGISATSLAGGGGDGGLAFDAVIGGSSASTTGRFTSHVGGSGGSGGASGNVSVINRTGSFADSGTIATLGDKAHGIFAQSLAGGGGNGGSVLSITGLASTSDSFVVGLNVGGFGGAGSSAGTVDVENYGLIETRGDDAHGILAQSIGGGGGNGGLALAITALLGAPSNSPVIAVGGLGGDGGDANTVSVSNFGNIVTRGAGSHGIVAQSIGGGGGNANMGISLSGSTGTIASNGFSALLGAAASSDGGMGGRIFVENDGDISVYGDGSAAFLAQSINGGGGSLALSFDGLSALPSLLLPDLPDIPIPGVPPTPGTPDIPTTGPIFEARLGGEDVADMNAGLVEIISTGTIGAAGNSAAGSVAQSIGGGGGVASILITLGVPVVENPAQGVEGKLAADAEMRAVDSQIRLGGLNGINNSGNSLTHNHVGEILTNGIQSPGLIMQSIGGGGGRANVTIDAPAGSLLGLLDLGLGATGGLNENGGAVSRTHSGQVVTTGAMAPGAILQSIGGGGGSAGVRLTGVEAANAQIALTLGGSGSALSSGADVTGLFDGGLMTTGSNSVALLAQSIGAGGGETRVLGASGVTVSLGGQADAAGDAGAVSISNAGIIQSAGERSHGVLLQSIGGGGGAVMTDAGDIEYSLNADNSGDGGAIMFVQAGDILTQGDESFGAILQSLGGGGGWIDGVFAGSAGGAGQGGAVSFAIDGTIWAVGLDSTGVLAQSTGRDGGGDIFGQLTGLVRGGSGTGRGLWIDGGADNVFTISGSVSALSNRAIEASTGNDAVINTGLVVGNVDLGSGVNSFDNQAGSTFIAMDTINLRDAAPVTQTPLVLQSEPRISASPLAAEVAAAWAEPVVMDALDPAKPDQTTDVNGAAASPAILVNLDDALADLDRVAAPAAPVMVNLDQAMSSLNQLMADPAPASDMIVGGANAAQPESLEIAKGAEPVVMATFDPGAAPAMIAGGENSAQNAGNTITVMDLPPVIDAAPANTGPLMIPGGDNLAQTGSIETTGGTQPVVMAALDPGLVAIVIDGGAEAAQPVTAGTTKDEQPVVMATLDPGVGAVLIDGGAEASQPEPVELTKDASPVVMAVFEPEAASPLVIGMAAPAFAFPTFASPPIAAASFSNSGDFLMGLSASALPIDLLNGAEFGHLDAMGDAGFNLYYGTRVINTVVLDGNFEQTASGHMAFDVAFGPYASDRVEVTGTAIVDGTGDVLLTWLENTDPVTLFAAAGGGTDHGLEITDTMAVDFSIAADAAGIHLLIDTDFGLPSLDQTGQALGGQIDSALKAGGSSGIGRLAAFLGNMQAGDLDAYEAVFSELNPEAHVAALHGQLSSANTMASDLFNCGTVVSSQDDQCVWTRLEQSTRDRTAGTEDLGVDSNATRFSGGFQQPLGQDWSLAFAIGYEEISQTLIDGIRARSSGQGFTAGLGMERQSADGYNYGFSVSGGWTWLETARSVTVFEAGSGLSEPETGHLRLDGHVGNVFRNGSFFAAPSLNVGLTALRHDGLTETGLDGLGVQVVRDTQLIASLNPVLRLGHVFHESETRTGTVSLTMGARLSSVDQIDIPVRFTGANANSAPALISTVLDQNVYQLGADINIVGNERVSVSFGYNAEFGEETEHHRTGLDFRLRF
tara:strand:- start:8281 stop:21054 length:12774 start_codon:yes stop_codon:yes gene_type:complete